MPRLIDLTSQTFYRLTVIRRIVDNTKKHAVWLCKCECGNHTIVQSDNLRSGHTKSCGCLNKENIHKHGYTNTNIHNIWKEMIQRCTNPNHKSYKNYGDRGIKICDRWLQSNGKGFINFLKDIGKRPAGMTLDRIDNNGNYCKENCRWTTRQQQNTNYRRNRMITINNQTKCITEWCNIFKLNRQTVYQRLRRGWSIKKTFELEK